MRPWQGEPPFTGWKSRAVPSPGLTCLIAIRMGALGLRTLVLDALRLPADSCWGLPVATLMETSSSGGSAMRLRGLSR